MKLPGTRRLNLHIPNCVEKGMDIKVYEKSMDSYSNAEPATGRLTRPRARREPQINFRYQWDIIAYKDKEEDPFTEEARSAGRQRFIGDLKQTWIGSVDVVSEKMRMSFLARLIK